MNTITNSLERANTQAQQLDKVFLQGILEGFIDGILILSTKGKILHANESARLLLHKLTPDSKQSNLVPKQIWRVCQALKYSVKSYHSQAVIIDSHLTTSQSTTVRIRVRWLKLELSKEPLILVTLEDQHQSIQNLVLAEVYHYGLTPREAEVWLLRRVNYSYKDIAAKLFITLSTVKKHMKNIHAKQKMALFLEHNLVSG
ncbi:MAG: helix-turn-helix transcriptional regulator [Moorea sp. SIOASIH]|uniref:LuxR C-terminal-related transcriptional regulator n=1 Tax=Moorena sp. SIOASIH TaxID=2607817 RepID=UPI0013B81C64|nr:LuxR C-terminal-related transcriptional regulator [Moorena sp. SIOASIH]NEO39538.1 helix-turn-helix transcriptional regulator [Moorena sp. SIOASIH]